MEASPSMEPFTTTMKTSSAATVETSSAAPGVSLPDEEQGTHQNRCQTGRYKKLETALFHDLSPFSFPGAVGCFAGTNSIFWTPGGGTNLKTLSAR
jgi:hypothetical protein